MFCAVDGSVQPFITLAEKLAPALTPKLALALKL